jgi:hypothetical protein
MKQYTQAEFDALEVVYGVRQCPTGDYRLVSSFGSGCSFGWGCRFGSGCTFGSGCSFGSDCGFGSGCTFGSGCSFGWGCRFGSGCTFGSGCRFGSGCHFGSGCSFGWGCRFGSDCSFGSNQTFEGHKAKEGYPFLSIGGAGSVNRTSYFFNFEDGIYVRSGCFFGTLEQFREKVLDDCVKDSVKAVQYLGFADIAEKTFKGATT